MVEVAVIDVQQRACPGGNRFEIVYGYDAEKLRWMGRRSRIKIIDAPDATSERGLSDNPATT